MNCIKYKRIGIRIMKDLYRPSGKDYLYVNDNSTLKLDKNYITSLKRLAEKNKDRKCTMCLHNDIRAHVHEMINVYPKDAYVRPHSHPFKTETKIMIEGKLHVVIFDSKGQIVDDFIMEKDGIFTFRIDKGIIHTNIPLTDVIFHEVIEGPFIGQEDSVFPSWVPESDDDAGIKKIMEKLGHKI